MHRLVHVVSSVCLFVITATASDSTASPDPKQRQDVGLNRGYSFKHPTEFGTRHAGEAGCCSWRYTPLPAPRHKRLPSLIGIGAHKAGTSFVYNMLRRHPRLRAPTDPKLWSSKKELMLFNTWPLHPHAFSTYLDSWGPASSLPLDAILYEVTATYLHVPAAACRMAELLPDAKLVVVLRNPVERALSHYNMQLELYRTQQSSWKPPAFAEAVTKELDKLQQHNCTFGWNESESQKTYNDCFRCWMIPIHKHRMDQLCHGLLELPRDSPCNPALNSGMFVSFGLYAAQLSWWLHFFRADQLLVLQPDELKQDPVSSANRIADFMGIEHFSEDLLAGMTEQDGNKYAYHINASDPDVSRALKLLEVFYDKPNRDLQSLLVELA